MAVVALSVISYPGSKDFLMSIKLTRSGFVVHGVAYFLVFHYATSPLLKRETPVKPLSATESPSGCFTGQAEIG